MFTKIRMKEEKGFTLIELLIVVAIIGILAAIAIPQFAAYRKRGYASAVKSDLKNLYTAAQGYFSEKFAGTVSPTNLATKGFVPSAAVSAGGSMTATGGSFTGSSKSDTTIKGTIDSKGVITGTFQ